MRLYDKTAAGKLMTKLIMILLTARRYELQFELIFRNTRADMFNNNNKNPTSTKFSKR